MKTLTDFCKTVETGVDPRLQKRAFIYGTNAGIPNILPFRVANQNEGFA